MQGPKVTSSSASSSTLPNTEESPLLPPSPETQHREEEDTTGRANGRQGSYSLLMGSRVGGRDLGLRIRILETEWPELEHPFTTQAHPRFGMNKVIHG